MSANKRQSSLRTFGKVSKAGAFPAFVKPTKEALLPSNKLCAPTKRKRDDSDDDTPAIHEADELAFDKIFTKKVRLASLATSSFAASDVSQPKIRCSTPPPSQPIVAQSPSSAINKLSIASTEPPRSHRATTPEDLPAPLRDILSIHENLLKGLSIHFAHNGPSTPAEVKALCKTIQCLWKKRRVTIEDLQRVLALHELAVDHHVPISSENSIGYRRSSFKLTTASAHTCLEYVGASTKKFYRGGLNRSPFSEKHLQTLFKADVQRLHLIATSDSPENLHFLNGPLSRFPFLRCDIGAQTEQRIAKASTARMEIMDVAKASQSRQNAKVVIKVEDVEEPIPEQVSQKLKFRTMSLFERVKAKQLANAANGTPTPASILRQHAIGRVGEVVEILRMKQQQKQSAAFNSAIDDSPSKVRVNKVAFGFAQIIQEIKNSVSIPIQDDEAKMCLELLSKDVEGTWLTTFELGSVKSVVLQGTVTSGVEIQKELEAKEKARKL